jgi:hypothetical protein
MIDINHLNGGGAIAFVSAIALQAQVAHSGPS